MDTTITVTGNLGADPRIRTVGPEHTPVADFTIAHTPRLREGEGWKDGTTVWYRVTCWRRLAQNVMGSLRRGDGIVVTGKLRCNEWIDKDGVVHRSDEIEATTLGPDLTRNRAVVLRNPPRSLAAAGDAPAADGTPPGGGTEDDYDELAPDVEFPEHPEEFAGDVEREGGAGEYESAVA